jgi:hypothetical protein
MKLDPIAERDEARHVARMLVAMLPNVPMKAAFIEQYPWMRDFCTECGQSEMRLDPCTGISTCVNCGEDAKMEGL